MTLTDIEAKAFDNEIEEAEKAHKWDRATALKLEKQRELFKRG
jgi:hypothetical protein